LQAEGIGLPPLQSVSKDGNLTGQRGGGDHQKNQKIFHGLLWKV